MEVGDREFRAVTHWQCRRSTKLCQNYVPDADYDYAAFTMMLLTVKLLILMTMTMVMTVMMLLMTLKLLMKLTTAAPPKMRKGKEGSLTPRPAMNGAMKPPILKIRYGMMDDGCGGHCCSLYFIFSGHGDYH